MNKFLDVERGNQRKILVFFKEKMRLTWREVAEALNINRSMLYFYLNDSCRVPFSHIEKLCDISKVPINNFNDLPVKQIKYYTNAGFSAPDTQSNRFAELVGILLGDGCIYSNKETVCISGNKILDEVYFKRHLRLLFLELFSVEPSFYYSKKQNSVRCVVNNKKIADFLANGFFVVGDKIKARARIPLPFFENKESLKYCLRGLFDTDGCICPHPNTKIMFCLTIKNHVLMDSTLEAFSAVGFPVKQSNGDIYFYGEKKVRKFFEEIGSSNFKHLIKWKLFEETGRMPKTKEIEAKIKIGPGES